MKKVLMLTPYLPYPPVSGGRMRTYSLLKRLVEQYEITLVCYGRPEEQAFDLQPLHDMCKTIVIDRPSSPSTAKAAIMTLTSIKPITMRLYNTQQFKATIHRLLAERDYDVVHVESFYMLQNLPEDLTVPVLLSEPAIEHVAWWRHARVAEPVYQRPGIALEALKMRIWGPKAWHRADLLGVMSEIDAQIVGKIAPDVPTHPTPNGVDVEYFRPGDGERNPNSAMFMGDYKYFPNTDAILYFMREIMPLILAEQPDFTLTLLGKDAPPELVNLSKDPSSGLKVERLVDDTRPYLTSSGMFVCPLRSGSGTRFKLMESLACGCPVVTTSLGCEGLNPVDGEHMLLADTPREFADAVLRLVKNPAEASTLGEQGRAWVVENHAWERSAALVAEAYERLSSMS